MSTKHTPGPWKAIKDDIDDVVQSTDGTAIAFVNRFVDSPEANARLIAAAPEILEALERLLQAIHMGIQEGMTFGELEHEMKAAHAAIAKAEGRKS